MHQKNSEESKEVDFIWNDLETRVARCPVFNRTVRYFGSLSGIKMIVIPDNTCVNSSIFCATDIGTASVQYFGESHLATLLEAGLPLMPKRTFSYP